MSLQNIGRVPSFCSTQLRTQPRAVLRTFRSTGLVIPSQRSRRLQTYTHHRSYASSSTETATTAAGRSAGKAPTFEAEIPLPDGSTQKVTIQPTPKADPSKLTEELKALLTTSRETPAIWTLDAQGDAVHCAAVVPTRAEAEKISERTMIIANEMNHHPHISKDEMVLGCQMLITCTTHNPAGLGLRDVRLATSISRIIKECQVELQEEAARAYRDTALAQLQKHREEMECAVCK